MQTLPGGMNIPFLILEGLNTMNLEDIKNMEVPAKEDCLLFMWATAPKLDEALGVLNAWGFTYRSCLIWDKMKIGMGYWFRVQHELLLVGVKGKVHPPPPTERISSIFKRKRSNIHSRKPNEIRKLISQWYPDKSKIELFARQQFKGWESWGNETEKGLPKWVEDLL